MYLSLSSFKQNAFSNIIWTLWSRP